MEDEVHSNLLISDNASFNNGIGQTYRDVKNRFFLPGGNFERNISIATMFTTRIQRGDLRGSSLSVLVLEKNEHQNSIINFINY